MPSADKNKPTPKRILSVQFLNYAELYELIKKKFVSINQVNFCYESITIRYYIL